MGMTGMQTKVLMTDLVRQLEHIEKLFDDGATEEATQQLRQMKEDLLNGTKL